MKFREILGLVLVITGLILIPVGLAFSKSLWAISFGLFGFGVWLFYTERMFKKELEIEKEKDETGGKVGAPMPSNIHDNSGWSRGGRSENWDSSFEDFGDGD